MKNECRKQRHPSNPYEVWTAGDWQWLVLKKYQTPENEKKNPYARWYCLVITPMCPDGEYGDTYVKDIVEIAGAVKTR